MRMILLGLAAIGAAAAGAAAAQPAPTAAHRGGPRAGTPAPTVDFISRGHRGVGRGMERGPRHHGRGRGGRGGDRFGHIWGYVEAIPYGAGIDPHGSGFFAGRGGAIRMHNGRPVYDYDRSYPYEWASGTVPGTVRQAAWSDEDAVRCTIEHQVKVCRARR